MEKIGANFNSLDIAECFKKNKVCSTLLIKQFLNYPGNFK